MDEQYPVNLEVKVPERSNRLYALLFLLFIVPKIIILIPHFVILWFLSIASIVVVTIAQFAVLFTGRYPAGLFSFVVRFMRWQVRVNAFLLGLTDRYPPFSLQ